MIMMLTPILAIFLTAGFVQPVYAACGSSTAAQQVSQGIDETSNASCDSSGVQNAISEAVNILSLVAGAAAIIAIIFSGFKYITSGGDTGKVANAKNTLIYAVIGIAVAILAQVIVNVTINASQQALLPDCKTRHDLHPPDCRQ